MKMMMMIVNSNKNMIARAETRTPGLTRKSNSTLSLVNDVDMEVADPSYWIFLFNYQKKVKKSHSGAGEGAGGDVAGAEAVKLFP